MVGIDIYFFFVIKNRNENIIFFRIVFIEKRKCTEESLYSINSLVCRVVAMSGSINRIVYCLVMIEYQSKKIDDVIIIVFNLFLKKS